MRAQVSSVGRLKNIAAIVPKPRAACSAHRPSVRGLKLAVVVEQEGLDELPRLAAGATRRRTARRGAPRRSRSASVSLALARLAQHLDAAHAAVAVQLDLEHRNREQRLGHRADVGDVRDWRRPCARRPAGAPRPSCARVPRRRQRRGFAARRSGAGLTRSSGAAGAAPVGGTGWLASPGPRVGEPVQPASGQQAASRERASATADRGANAFNEAHGRSPRPAPARCLRRVARSSTLAWPTPRTPPKRCSRRARFFGPTPGMSSSRLRAGAHAGAARAHAGDREAVRLVADLRHQHQRRRIAAEVDLRAAVGEHQLLEPDLAALALLDADDQRAESSPSSSNTSRAIATWPRAAVDQHQVGQARRRRWLGRLGQLGVAARQHLAHRRVVVAAA